MGVEVSAVLCPMLTMRQVLVLNAKSVIPRPLDLYSALSKGWLLPLDFIFSVAWALELYVSSCHVVRGVYNPDLVCFVAFHLIPVSRTLKVSRFEAHLTSHLWCSEKLIVQCLTYFPPELTFWLYLLHQNPQKEEWFSSWEYRVWYMGESNWWRYSLIDFLNLSICCSRSGSMVAIIGMPLTALITRNDLLTVSSGIVSLEQNDPYSIHYSLISVTHTSSWLEPLVQRSRLFAFCMSSGDFLGSFGMSKQVVPIQLSLCD